MFVKKITNDLVAVKAPAKINLFLEVLNRRPDGYHNINSLFQAISLYDRLEIERTEKPGLGIEVTPSGAAPTGADNLISRAYDLMFAKIPDLGGLVVRLEKRIPILAGLGGGSSNAAAMLLGCNELCGLTISRSVLATMALEIGSDVPFFLSRGQAIVSGRGEQISETFYPLDYHIVLVTPKTGISTAAAYPTLKRVLTNPKQPFSLDSCPTAEALLTALKLTGNDFEAVPAANHPSLRKIREWLTKHGAEVVRMSGSGSTLFGLFVREPNHQMLVAEHGENWQIQLVRPVCQPEKWTVRGGNCGDN